MSMTTAATGLPAASRGAQRDSADARNASSASRRVRGSRLRALGELRLERAHALLRIGKLRRAAPRVRLRIPAARA